MLLAMSITKGQNRTIMNTFDLSMHVGEVGKTCETATVRCHLEPLRVKVMLFETNLHRLSTR